MRYRVSFVVLLFLAAIAFLSFGGARAASREPEEIWQELLKSQPTSGKNGLLLVRGRKARQLFMAISARIISSGCASTSINATASNSMATARQANESRTGS